MKTKINFYTYTCRCEGDALRPKQSPTQQADCFVAKNKNAPRNDINITGGAQ